MTDDFHRNGKEEADNRLLASMTPEGRERARRINAINGGYIVTKRHQDV